MNYFHKLFRKKLANKLTQKETLFLEKFEEKLLEKNSGSVFNSDDDLDKIKNDILKSIKKDISSNKNQNYRRKVVRLNSLQIAASIVLIFFSSITIILLSQTDVLPLKKSTHLIVKKAEKGKTLEVILPDSSFVTLNSESSIIYPSKFKNNKREVSLIGEAFFEVIKNKNKPFIVKTSSLYTKVLGTSFNINSYDSSAIVVTLSTGKVQVYNNSDSITIKPNQQILFDKKNQILYKRDVNASQFIDWRYGIIRLNNVTLNNAIKIIERKYDVKILQRDSLTKPTKFSATFKNEPIENVIRTLSDLNNNVKLKIIR